MTACQPEPGLTEFQPANNSLFKITFSYPSDWVWQSQIPFDEIGSGEVPPPSELIVSQTNGISIQVYKPSNPKAQMQEWMDAFLGAIADLPHTDTIIQIDGYDARWLSVNYPSISIPSISVLNEAHTQELIYLLVEDRFYSIGAGYVESEKNGRIYEEFKMLIKTIKILQ